MALTEAPFKEQLMNRKQWAWLLAIAGLCFTPSVRAQMGPMGGMMRPPAMQGVFNPVVGSGAAYEITDKKQQKNTMEITVVGKETVNGKDAFWMETGVQDPKSGTPFYMKMLIAPAEGNAVTQRMIMQIPGQPNPMEMSTTMQTSRGGDAKPQSTDFRTKAERVGTESITTPAGTFECEHWKMSDGSGDVWFSAKVAPWGMVKYTGKDTSMLLTKVITDAKDHITGTPVKFDPMQMMRQQMPKS
jgi:hypothetical protein